MVSEKSKFEKEIVRLNQGPLKDEPIPGIGVIQFLVRCRQNSKEVLSLASKVMEVVCRQSIIGWTNENNWRTIIPQSFVSACAEEMSKEQAEE
jgi:hypothetical protein